MSVFENRVLRRIVGPSRKEVTGSWRRLHNEELHNLYHSTYTVVIKLTMMSLPGHVAHLGEIRNAKFVEKNLKGGNHVGELDLNGRIILKLDRA
jgi:hypothetical protein